MELMQTLDDAWNNQDWENNVIVGESLKELDGFGSMVVSPLSRLWLPRPVNGRIFSMMLVELSIVRTRCSLVRAIGLLHR